MSSPTQIIDSYLRKADRARLRDNAFLYRSILSRLRSDGLETRAGILERRIQTVSDGQADPAVDGQVLRLYRSANRALARPLPLPAPDCAAVRRRELWKIYRRHAAVLATASLHRQRLLFVTMTVSARLDWATRLLKIRLMMETVARTMRRFTKWYLHAYDVMGEPNGRSPHTHSLYVIDSDACDTVARELRNQGFRAPNLRWRDQEDRTRDGPLRSDAARRREWLDALAYVMKVSGDCGERHFLPREWDDAFQHVRLDPAYAKDPGSHALAIKAMDAHYAPGSRIIRAAQTLKLPSAKAVSPRPSAAVPPSPKKGKRTPSVASKGRPTKDPGKAALLAFCRAHATMKDRASASGLTEKTFRLRMRAYGIETPRGNGKK